LTAHQSLFNPGLEDKVSILFPDTDFAYLRQRADETRGPCFLCDARWQQTTPRYSEELIPGGRLVRGEVVLFPNLFPLAAYHAVVRLGDVHFRTLEEFPASLFEDALSVAVDFVRRVHRMDSSMLWFTINANYLFPAGASVLHPHLQIIGSPQPGTHHRMLMERSLDYLEKNRSCYWTDLVETEAGLGGRLIASMDTCRWVAAYSPLGANEMNGIWLDSTHFLEWEEGHIRDAAQGISGMLRGYHEMKLSTFNFSCFSGPVDRRSPEFRCMLRLINRQNANPHYRTDDYYFQKLLKNEIVITRPEQLAALMRRQFSR
jgi:galactose-1-phosphate uridylyltransferase